MTKTWDVGCLGWRRTEDVLRPLTTTLRGSGGTLLLAIRDDDAIDWGRTAETLDVLVRAGLDGVHLHGAAREFHTLDEDEYDRVNVLAAGRCAAAGVPLQIGAGRMSAQTCPRRVGRARELGPAAMNEHRRLPVIPGRPARRRRRCRSG